MTVLSYRETSLRNTERKDTTMANQVNYYVELSLDRGVSPEELAKELKKQRSIFIGRANRATDVDKRVQAEKRVDMIQEALPILSDEQKKAEYDRILDEQAKQSGEAYESGQSSKVQINMDEIELVRLQDMAIQAYDNGSLNEAILCARKAIARGLVSEELYDALVMSLFENGNKDQAYQAMLDMTKALPDDPNVHLKAASYLMTLFQKPDEAKVFLDRLYQDGYGDRGNVARLAIAYDIHQDEFDMAMKKLDDYIAKKGENQKMRNLIAQAFEAKADMCRTDLDNTSVLFSQSDYRQYVKCMQYASKAAKASGMINPYRTKITAMGGLHFLDERGWIGPLTLFITGVILGYLEIPVFAILFVILAVVFLAMNLLPGWQVERFQYLGKLYGVREVFRIINMVIAAVGMGVKFIISLFLG